MVATSGVFDVVCVIDVMESVGVALRRAEIPFSTNISRAFCDDVDAVIVTTPTQTHFSICRSALEHNKHVFVEKPMANNVAEYKELYSLARARERCLYIGFNRRHDPEWLGLSVSLGSKVPLHISVVCRDHPFPPVSYLQTCGGIFRDCVIHDIDMICHMLYTYPSEVECSLDEKGETASTRMTFNIDQHVCRVNMIHSRHSPTYEQYVSLFCEDGCIEMGRIPLPLGTSFDERYRSSYSHQMKDFAKYVNSMCYSHNIGLSHSVQLERIIDACDESARSGTVHHIKSLRAYEAAETNVKELYRKARSFHTVETVSRLRQKYRPCMHGSLTIWEALDALRIFKDMSDPDVEVPNDQHALQTAESIRKAGLPDWMQLIGLIHDFGKIIYKWGDKEDGTTMDTQFSIVGDTFVVGCDPRPRLYIQNSTKSLINLVYIQKTAD